MTYGLISHECAHVEITAEKEHFVPDARFGTEIHGFERAVMFQVAEICWDEYAACRISAMFNARQNETHAETVCASANVARRRSNDAIREYRLHGNLDRLIQEAGPPLCQPIKAAAYLLGGMDAVGEEWSDQAETEAALIDADYLELVNELWAELRRLWDTRGTWEPSLSVFSGLEAVANDVFRSGGIIFSTSPEGECNVDVPFSPQTMP